jgi:tRNA(adenine34) deaminase
VGLPECLERGKQWGVCPFQREIEHLLTTATMKPRVSANEQFMRLALGEASKAQAMGEVPVGAVVVLGDEVIGRGCNRNLTDKDPSAHAEIVALRNAGSAIGNHRLLDCELYVTIEPCAMCAGALIQARLKRLVYGAADSKAGAVKSVLQVLNHPALNHQMEIVPGLLADECGLLLQDFFRKRRTREIAEV